MKHSFECPLIKNPSFNNKEYILGSNFKLAVRMIYTVFERMNSGKEVSGFILIEEESDRLITTQCIKTNKVFKTKTIQNSILNDEGHA